ncbi:TPA: type II toxin-antitoxin system PemK/MazF family toxin [Klebsiella pneumoniae]
MKKGEIWDVDLDPTAGNEQAGFRPVLIVSPDVFNNATQAPICVPITNGGDFARVRGFAIEITPEHSIKTTGVVRCDQPRTLSIKARNGKLIETVPEALLNDVVARLTAIIKA